MRARWTAISMLAWIALTVLAGCDKKAADPRTEAPLVRLVTVKAASGTAQSFSGVVRARVESDLGFRIAGKVVERLIDVGQVVHKDQPLLRLDATDLSLVLAAQDQAVTVAQVHETRALADEARLHYLVAAGDITKQNYDDAKAAADSAKAALAAARAQADVARNALTYAVLRADADGVVMSTMAEPGQVVGAGQTVIRLAHSGPREAVVNLPETNRPALGSAAVAKLYGAEPTEVATRLRQLSDSADPQTRTFEARYVLEGPAATAPLGTTVTVSIANAQPAGSVAAPIGALYDGGQGPGVWLFDAQSSAVTFRPVVVGRIGVEMAVISSGLAPGDQIVALGAHLLHSGESVRVEGEAIAAR
jgi:RND family efflux transporter MFP subunit